MNGIFGLFMVLIIIAAVLLVIIIMAQNPKGGGLSGTFGGASSATFGVQRTNDFMEKATWTLGGIIILLIFLSVALSAKPMTKKFDKTPAKTEKSSKSQTPVKPTAKP